MIEINITGGLGNQLFQYACARQLQKRYNDKIILNPYEMNTDVNARDFVLDKFHLNSRVEINNNKMPWYVHRRSIVGKLLRKVFPQIYFMIAKKFGAYVWYQDTYYPIDHTAPATIYLGGYWQSPKYFEGVIDEVKHEINLIESYSGQNMELINKIECSNSVCVHIRRGDYVNTDYDVCTLNYYKKAMEEMKNLLEKPVFFVFSDDLSWCKKNLTVVSSIIFVDNQNPDYVDLSIMKKCKHYIISNSSFSWWAQFLGINEEKIVIAPSKWHKVSDSRELYLDSWKVIDV